MNMPETAMLKFSAVYVGIAYIKATRT